MTYDDTVHDYVCHRTLKFDILILFHLYRWCSRKVSCPIRNNDTKIPDIKDPIVSEIK